MDALGITFFWGALPGTQEEEGAMEIWVQRVPAGPGWVSGQEEWKWRQGEALSACCRVLGCVLSACTPCLGPGALGPWGWGEDGAGRAS